MGGYNEKYGNDTGESSFPSSGRLVEEPERTRGSRTVILPENGR